MTEVLADFAVADEGDSLEAPPLPLLVCWAIWIALSAALWLAAWRMATILI